MDFESLSPELREKVLACKTSQELVELAEEQGITLSDEQLDAISGGSFWSCEDYECHRDDW